MNKKIAIYTISKNEEKHAKAWATQCLEITPHVYVLDTGSTDNTVNILKDSGVNVETKVYDQFRFDVARNDSLKLVPADIDYCLIIDIDEKITPNCAKRIINQMGKEDFTIGLIRRVNSYANVLVSRVHSRNVQNLKWVYPLHEQLYLDKYHSTTVNHVKITQADEYKETRDSRIEIAKLGYEESKDKDYPHNPWYMLWIYFQELFINGKYIDYLLLLEEFSLKTTDSPNIKIDKIIKELGEPNVIDIFFFGAIAFFNLKTQNKKALLEIVTSKKLTIAPEKVFVKLCTQLLLDNKKSYYRLCQFMVTSQGINSRNLGRLKYLAKELLETPVNETDIYNFNPEELDRYAQMVIDIPETSAVVDKRCK